MEWLAWFLVAISGAVAAYWTLVVVRLALLLPRLPRVRGGLASPVPPGGWPTVSVIVPAHNEERVIESCAASLLASDYPALEIVVVLDRCTDRTLELLRPFAERDARLRIIENRACPPDWAGKCNAARVGAEQASGRYLLFTDADVEFAPALIRAAMGLAIAESRGLLSLLPSLVAEAWYERVVQPVAAMTLLQMYPIDKVNRAERRRPFANGQFLLFDRRVYEAIGGHAATKDDLLEDIAFARLVDASGARVGIALADDMLVVHMYSSLDAMRTGWKRIFIEACHRKVGRLRTNAVRTFALGVVSPIAQLASVLVAAFVGGPVWMTALVAILVGLAAQAVALNIIFGTSRLPRRGAIFFPLGSAIVAKALWDGAGDLRAGRPVRWG
ncbi:MAG: glycosyltransferase family 2 protein, partial [Phycisphaerae bacterium]|nr:glycosyltransferase family 2 protein [Phycisphaerae bacterium]